MAVRRVKLMSDYGAEWPLWEDGMVGSDHLDLSPGLAADLRAWQELFDREFHWDGGWRTAEAEERYARQAADVLHRLRDELGPGFEVRLDPWPVTTPHLSRWLEHRG